MKHRAWVGYRVATVALVCLAMSGAIRAGDEEASVTPYRPTVSNPAALSAPGWLEVELGLNRQQSGDGSRQTTLPYVLKYAFSADFGILLGGDAQVQQTDPTGARIRGQGDTLLLFKHRWAVATKDDDSALGLEWGAKFPTAGSTLGSGQNDYLVNGIYSTEMAGNALDFNLNATRLGQVAPGTGNTQWGWAATISRSLNERWGLAAELSSKERSGMGTDKQALVAVSYALSKRVVLDAGMAMGLTPASADKSLFFGLSFLLGKVR